jgi:hypothetical protein
MPDPTKRIAAWNAKTAPERTKQTLEARYAEMQRRYAAAMADLVSAEGQIRQTLNAQGVHTSLYVPYLNYGRQLWKMIRQQEIDGESAAMAAQVLLDKWAARGLNPKVLAAVRTEVFNIAEPKK